MMKKTGILVGLVALAVGVGLSCGPEETTKTADKPSGGAKASEAAKSAPSHGGSEDVRITFGGQATASSTAAPQASARQTTRTTPAAKGSSRSENVQFASNAFPPTIPDSQDHQDAWQRNDCLRCHETGVDGAPAVRHAGMSPILLKAKCRSCHVFIKGAAPQDKPSTPSAPAGRRPQFAANAFPPMIPTSEAHANAWMLDNCLDCHLRGKEGAPKIRHRGLPSITIKAKCRTCHVQARAAGIDDPG